MTLLNKLKKDPIRLNDLYSEYTEDDLIKAIEEVSSSPKRYDDFEKNNIYTDNMVSIIENIYLRNYLRRNENKKSKIEPIAHNISTLVTYLTGLKERDALYQ